MQNLNVSRQNEPTTPRAPDTGRPTARHTQSSRHRNEGRGLRPFATGHRGACMHGHVQKALTAIYTLDCGFRSRRQWNTSLQISSNNVSVEWVIMWIATVHRQTRAARTDGCIVCDQWIVASMHFNNGRSCYCWEVIWLPGFAPLPTVSIVHPYGVKWLHCT
jgi:hypothetical protein